MADVLNREKLGAWCLRDPRDPARRNLIIPGEGGYHLDPTWEVVQLDFVYTWWGLGDPVFDHQRIVRQHGGYWKEGEPADGEAVGAFLRSVARLHPIGALQSWTGLTDHEPAWGVELKGADGERVLLHASSPGNPGAGPWNVLHNGRLYAQYDGSVGESLEGLFDHLHGEPRGYMFFGGPGRGKIAFTEGGVPYQLNQGLAGLLPLAADVFSAGGDFSYTIDEEPAEIRGLFATPGARTHGALTRLLSVELTDASGRRLPCEVTPARPAASPSWTFRCPVGHQATGQRYRFSIHVTYETDTGAVVASDGELFGDWGTSPDALLMPPSPQVQAAMKKHPEAAALLEDHVLASCFYGAEIQIDDPTQGVRAGQVKLLGQTRADSSPLRYTVTTVFAIKDREMVRWDLTRAELEAMRQTIVGLALVGRVLKAAPGTILHMSYVGLGDLPNLKSLRYFNPGRSLRPSIQVRRGGTGELQAFPAEGRPLCAFRFCDPVSPYAPFFVDVGYGAEFVLVDGWPVLHALQLDERHRALWPVLLPAQLHTGQHQPFARVRMENLPLDPTRPQLTLKLPSDPDPASRRHYDEIARSLPVPVEKSDWGEWTASGLTFVVTDAGTVEMVASDCPRHVQNGWRSLLSR